MSCPRRDAQDLQPKASKGPQRTAKSKQGLSPNAPANQRNFPDGPQGSFYRTNGADHQRFAAQRSIEFGFLQNAFGESGNRSERPLPLFSLCRRASPIRTKDHRDQSFGRLWQASYRSNGYLYCYNRVAFQRTRVRDGIGRGIWLHAAANRRGHPLGTRTPRRRLTILSCTSTKTSAIPAQSRRHSLGLSSASSAISLTFRGELRMKLGSPW